MIAREYGGIMITVPKEEFSDILMDKRIEQFIDSTQDIIMSMDWSLPMFGVEPTVIGKDVILAHTPTELTGNDLLLDIGGIPIQYSKRSLTVGPTPIFEVKTYNLPDEFNAAIHGVMVEGSVRHQSNFNGIRVYSPKYGNDLEDILKPFLDLPMIRWNGEDLTEDPHYCPAIYEFLSQGPVIDAYFVMPCPEGTGGTFIEKSTYAHPFIYEEVRSDKTPMEVYRALKRQHSDPDEAVVLLPTAACMANACASTRQELGHDMSEEAKINAVQKCKGNYLTE